MKTPRYITVMIGSVLCLVGFWPKVLLAQRTATDNHVAYYQQLLRRNPQNARAYHGLADALIRKARETGDPGYFDRAEAALTKSLEISPGNAGALRHLAYVFYSRHEFDTAAERARRAIGLDPTDAHAYGILGDALLEVGQYDKAAEAYRKMMDLDANLYSYSRAAGMRSMRGDTTGAMKDLERAIASGKTTNEPPESIAWAQWQLGSDRFTAGDLKGAEACFRQSLETYPNYHRALAGIAQLQAAQKRYDEAIQFYQKAIAIIPMPEYIAALGDIYEKTGRRTLARQQYDLVEYIAGLNAINKTLYNRELAYFYADHNIKLQQALELAQRELDYRKDIYAYDLLAWSLYRNGEAEKSRAAIEQALKLGTQDAKIFFHAGMIYYQLGEIDKAKEYLNRAMATNPHFHIFLSETAAQILTQIEKGSEHTGFERRRSRG